MATGDATEPNLAADDDEVESATDMSADSQLLSPSADAGKNVAVDYMKSRYEKDKGKVDPLIVPKVIREPRKLDFKWDKVVDEKLKRSEPSGPVIREQDLVALMLTCAGLDSGKSQYLTIVENAGRDTGPTSREPVEMVAPPEITKKVRDMFETGKLTEIHDSKTVQETYEQAPGSGVFENEPVRIEGVVRASDFNEEGENVQRGSTKNLLDHWKTKMTEDTKTTSKRQILVVEDEGQVLENTPERRDDVVREDDLDWEAFHIEKGLTKSLMSQWSTIGSKEFKPQRGKINVADAEGKVLESKPIRRNDVIRGDDVNLEGEEVQKGTTRNLLSQWSVKGTEGTVVERKRINVAEDEGRVVENEPIRRSDVVREEDIAVAGEEVERGITKSLLNKFASKDKEGFRQEKRFINIAEDEGRIAESDPVRRSDVVRADDVDDSDAVQKGTTRSLLAQWSTKGTEDYRPATGRFINLNEAEGKVLENDPVRRTDVVREGDDLQPGEEVQRGTTRSLLNQWQNKRDDFKKDKTPIVVAEGEGVVSENQPTRREDVVRENDFESEGDKIQRGTTKSLLNQWQNKKTEYQKEKSPIIITETEGTVAENDPVKRTDVIREEDMVTEGEILPRGITKSLLNQWTTIGSQEFTAKKRPINIAEDEGKVAENQPIVRSDVVRSYDNETEGDQVQKGTTKNLMAQWKTKGTEEFRTSPRKIVIAEDEGMVAENEPQRREDLIREYDQSAEVEVQRGFTRNLLTQWKTKGSEEFKGPKREIVITEDEGVVAENDPSPRHDASDPNSSGLLQWNGDVADGDLHPPPFEFPSPSESIVEVTKSEIIACGHLWVNFVRDGPIRSELHSRIQQYARLARRVEALETNMYVLAPYADVASTDYYRARIEDLEDLNATVFFVDYGNYQQTPVHELRTIDPALLQWPVQAAECFLAQIEPSAIKCPEKQWTSEAKDCFAHFLNESSVTYIQIFSIVHGIMRVTVNIKYRGDELNLNEELIRLNYADRVEESLASMQNHLLRERLMLDSCNPNPDNKPDLRTVCQLKEAEERSQIPKKSLGVVFLSGPSNPCEVGFSSTTLNGQLRTTRINRDSVNSVAFDMEPGSPSRRVLVAAFVGLLPTGRTITANGTTLMPNIPGLHGLLALLFCPTAELRADREKKRYVGAICGLGWDSETPDFDPAFPDHDMEVAFNTEFDVEDLKVINGVRIAINLALGTDKTNVEWSEDAVIKIQNTAREKLLWLMKRPRKTIPSNSELGSRAYRWRQVDERDILHPNVAEMDPGLALLTLHCGIALNIDSDDEEIQEMSAENKLIHQQYLESKAAKRSVEPQELFCELCQTILSCPEQLYYHLRTLEHRRKLPIV